MEFFLTILCDVCWPSAVMWFCLKTFGPFSLQIYCLGLLVNTDGLEKCEEGVRRRLRTLWKYFLSMDGRLLVNFRQGFFGFAFDGNKR